MIKLIITDIGGVMIKTDEAIITCIEAVFRENNIPFGSKKKLLSTFGTSLYDYVKNYLPSGHEKKVNFCYREFKKKYPIHAKKYMKVFPQVNQTLYFIKSNKIKVAVLSCMIKKEVQVNLSLLKFKEFDLIFSLDNYYHKRPDPSGLIKIMKTLGLKPCETLYVGDTVNDVKMAKNAKVISVAVTTGAQDSRKVIRTNPDYILASFSELKKLVTKLNNKQYLRNSI